VTGIDQTQAANQDQHGTATMAAADQLACGHADKQQSQRHEQGSGQPRRVMQRQ
jgi:hypothetical protein